MRCDEMQKDVKMSLEYIREVAWCVGGRTRVEHREQNEEGTTNN